MVKPAARETDVETLGHTVGSCGKHSRISLQAMEVLGVTAYEYNKLPEVSDELACNIAR